MSNLLNTDKEYCRWITKISEEYKRSQIKAATKVNNEMLKFYWSLGKEITEKRREYNWGDHFFENLSSDLRRVLPHVKSFSPSNLRYMQRFYLLYNQGSKILPQVGEETEDEIMPQLGAEIFMVPWGHHKVIIDKFSSVPDNINIETLLAPTLRLTSR